MATIDSLANETLIHIIEYLKGPPMPAWDNSGELQKGRYDALRAAALVCSRWRDPAQRALFDELHLPDRDDLRGQLFCTSSARPRYRTRSLCVHCLPGRQDAWFPVVKACAGLRSLTVLGDDGSWRNEDKIEWAVLAHPAFQGLKHLSLMYPEDFRDPDDTSTTLPFHLTSLSLWLDNTGGASPRFLHALTTASILSIETLNLRAANPVAIARFSPSFLLLGPYLRTLVLGASHDDFTPHNHYDLFTTLTSLRRLELDLAWLYEDDLSTGLEFLSTILDHLPDPPSLKHLVIKSTDLPFNSLLPVLDHTKLSILEELLWCYVGESSPVEWVELEAREATRVLCRRKGIRFEMTVEWED